MTRAADLAKLIAGSSTLGGTGELVLKDVDTADGSSPKITFQTGDTDIAADDVLGTIDFQAPDEGTGTDAILVSAGVEAKAEGDFSSSSNATSLTFKTGSSEAAAEKMRVDSSGLLRVANTTGTLFNSDSATGVVAGTSLQVSTDGSTVGYFNRLSSDGVVLGLYKDGSSVGSIGANGSRPFVAGPSKGIKFGNSSADPCTDSGGTADNSYDLGGSSVRWNNLYLSGGIFVGGTGPGNKLDDYEEGTWTPSFVGSSSESGQSYSTQLGTYVKIGRMVHAKFRVILSAEGTFSGTYILITGLPFNSASSPQAVHVNNCYFVSLGVNVYSVGLQLKESDNKMYLWAVKGANTSRVYLANTELTSTTELAASVVYQTA